MSSISFQGLLKQNITDWATETKVIYFLTILEARNLRSNLLAGLFFLRPLSLTCRWLPSLLLHFVLYENIVFVMSQNRINSTHPKIPPIVKSNRPREISTSLLYILKD